VQSANQSGSVNGGDIPNTSTDGLGLDVQMRLGGIARVPHLGKRLAELHVITDLNLDAAGTEMRHHQKVAASNVEDDVVTTLIAPVRRSDLLVRPAVEYEGHYAIGGCEYRFSVDVIVGDLRPAWLVATAVAAAASSRATRPPRNAIKKTR
jgi:hypothetical protein